MIRLSAAFVASLLIAAPAFAADLVVDAAAPPAADAPSRSYATFFAGASLPHADINLFDSSIPLSFNFDIGFDTGYIIGGAIGTTLAPSLRGEVEFSVVNSSPNEFFGIPVDSGINTTGYNLLGNLWYDFDTGSSFTPYIGGGLGYGYDVITGNGSSNDINTSGVLYQLGAGVRIAATDNIGLDLGYRYRVQPEAKVSADGLSLDPGDSVTTSATNHIVTAGVTVGF